MDDDVFVALSHPVRRSLLDLLKERDGRTLGELESHFPLTRFGVMKHLKVLESAHLVICRKVGREKLHFLNTVPIQEISDRWMSRYTAPFARSLVDIKSIAESFEREKTMTKAVSPRHVYELYIRASAETVWQIITDDEKTPLWQHFNMTSHTDWSVGGEYAWMMGDKVAIGGRIVEMQQPGKLVLTFSAQWAPDVAADQPSRVTFEIVPISEDACKLTLVHDDFAGETATSRAVVGGWPESLSRLKTLAETSEPFMLDRAG
jgi:uncharacterized protein YndB with AHSA1/START domain